MYRRLLLLGLLRQKEMHGYRLNEFIDRFLHVCSDLKKPTAYYLLSKMAEEGLVAESTLREGHYPERKVYSITPAGEEQFLALLRENLAGFERLRYPGDIGLAFLHELPAEERGALLTERRERLAAQLAALEAMPPHGGSLDLIFARNIGLLRAELEWLDDAMDIAARVEGLSSFPQGGADSDLAGEAPGR